MKKTTAFTLLILLTLAGAPAGYVAGPVLARANRTVQLAARIWEEDS
ncbi:unnamed protein product, partial [marine sediment metagenome]